MKNLNRRAVKAPCFDKILDADVAQEEQKFGGYARVQAAVCK